MKIFTYDSLCSIEKFPEHEKYKDQTLRLINSDRFRKNLKSNDTEDTMNIFSDWNTDKYSRKLYWKDLNNPLHEFIENVTTKM